MPLFGDLFGGRTRRQERRQKRKDARAPKAPGLFGSEEALDLFNQQNMAARNFGIGLSEQSLADQAQARQGMEGILSQQMALANDPSNSLAQQQLLAGQDKNVAQAQNLAASARGTGGQAAALRQAQQQAAIGGQQLNQQAGILRMQEQQQALSNAANIQGSIRQGDMGLLGQGLGQQSNMANLQLGTAGAVSGQEMQLLQIQQAAEQARKQQIGNAIGEVVNIGSKLAMGG